jgi:hypothetical protein
MAKMTNLTLENEAKFHRMEMMAINLKLCIGGRTDRVEFQAYLLFLFQKCP